MIRYALFLTIVITAISSVALAESPAVATTTPGAHVFFRNLTDGQTVTSPVAVEMGVEGMKVAPAGNVVQGEGHHHLIIDGGPSETLAVIPANETNIHFGQGQTEASIPLSPGKHTLTLQFADGAHRSYGPMFSKTIQVVVSPVTTNGN